MHAVLEGGSADSSGMDPEQWQQLAGELLYRTGLSSARRVEARPKFANNRPAAARPPVASFQSDSWRVMWFYQGDGLFLRFG